MTHIGLIPIYFEISTRSGRDLLDHIWHEVRNQPSLVDFYKTVRNDPHRVDFHEFVYPNEERNQIWQNCYEVRNQPSLVDIYKNSQK